METYKIILIFLILLTIGFLITNNFYLTYAEIEKEKYFNCKTSCSFSEEWKNYYKEKVIETCRNDSICFCTCKASVYSYKIYPILRVD